MLYTLSIYITYTYNVNSFRIILFVLKKNNNSYIFDLRICVNVETLYMFLKYVCLYITFIQISTYDSQL